MRVIGGSMNTKIDGEILKMEMISKSFNKIPALKNINLALNKGEVRALIGQNGAGKSTLIKVLNGAYTLDSGSIYFEKNKVQYHSPYEAQLAGVSTIFQEVNLLRYRTVAENICAGREIKKNGMINWTACNEFAQYALQMLDIDIDVTKPIDTYNVATQQLIAIVRAISFDAKVLIMDEPTASLDEAEKKVLFKMIKDLKERGVAILYVSHHLEELFEICDSVSVMRDGEMIDTLGISELTKMDMVSKMLGKNLDDLLVGDDLKPKRKVSKNECVLNVEQISGAGALKNVSFKLNNNEVLGFAGLLGSGRSEASRRLFGIDPSSQHKGCIYINGEEVQIEEPLDAIERGIAFCSEDRKHEGIIPHLSVRENLTLAILDQISDNGFINIEKEKEIVNQYIKQLSIKVSDMEQPISQLSGGNQQKVLLARWIANNSKILILDEPTRGIDVGAKGEIKDLILSLADNGVSVLFISSEYEEIESTCHRVLIMQEGVSRGELCGDGITENKILDALGTEHESIEV